MPIVISLMTEVLFSQLLCGGFGDGEMSSYSMMLKCRCTIKCHLEEPITNKNLFPTTSAYYVVTMIPFVLNNEFVNKSITNKIFLKAKSNVF